MFPVGFQSHLAAVQALPQPMLRSWVVYHRMARRWLLSLCLALYGLAVAGHVATPALAQSSKQTMDAIQRRMEEGLGLFVAEKPLEAAAVFERGYAEHPYSAFLFNAGICYEKVGNKQKALAKYQEYMRVDPNSPDIADIRQRVARLEGQGTITPGGVNKDAMQSLVVVETEPSGAPVRVFRPLSDKAPKFVRGGANPDWTEIATTTSPTSLSLSVGRYQILIDEYRDFNASDTELVVTPGHVHQFRANLSQGVFMAFLRISSNVRGAHLYLDDPNKAKPEWGTTPYGELVAGGEHDVVVEKPGFQPVRTKISLQPGERKELEVSLVRVDHGFIRLQADVDDVAVSLDGKPVGRWKRGDPPLDIPASAGPHALVVTAEDRKDFEGQVTVPKGQVLPIDVKMIPTYPRGTAWTQAVLAGVCIGTGIYLGLESERLKEDLDRDRQRGVLDTDDSRISKGFWFAVGADVGFGAGAVLGALSTWNFIKDPLPESSHEEHALVEFDDPLALPAQPAAPKTPPPAARIERRAPRETGVRLQLFPVASEDVAGIAIGGSF